MNIKNNGEGNIDMSSKPKAEKQENTFIWNKASAEPFENLNIPDGEKNYYADWRIIALFVGIFAFILLSRLIRLDFKPPMHDETMFFFYSYLFVKSGSYNYMPILHGPLFMFVSALVYTLIGATDYTLRLAVTIVSIGLFGWVWGLRKNIGWKATLFTFTFFALSPAIMYYSRFWRNDVPLEVCFLGSLYFFVKFLEKGKGSFLYGSLLFATAAFCTMENSIFFFFTAFTFFLIILFTDILSKYFSEKTSKKKSLLSPENILNIKNILPALISLFIICVISFIVFWRTFEGTLFKDEFTVKRFFTAGVAFKFYFMFFATAAVTFAILLFIVHSIRNNYGTSRIMPRIYGLITNNIFILISALISSTIIYILLFTTFLTNDKGFFQIYKETFAYWWGQHTEHRIKGAFHYHIPILLIYEFLPIFIIFGGLAVSLWREKFIKKFILPGWAVFTILFTMIFSFRAKPIDVQWWDKNIHLTSPVHIYIILTIVFFGMLQTIRYIMRKESLTAFFLYWFWVSLLMYSYAGEKVPWLCLHIAVPMFFVAGIYIQKLLNDDLYKKWKMPMNTVFFALLFLTFTTSMKLCFVDPWDTRERLVYGHTTIEVKDACDEIRRISALLGTREETEIIAEAGLLVNWPLRWYFRDNTQLKEIGSPETWTAPVCFISWDKVKPDAQENMICRNIMDNYHITKIRMLTWWQAPMPDFGLMCKIWKTMIPNAKQNPNLQTEIQNSKKEWRKIYRYVLFRETFDALNAQWPTVSSQDCGFCIRKDVFARVNTAK